MDPTAEDQEAFKDHAFTKVKKLKADFQIKNNPFVKSAPTCKTMYLVEQTETKLRAIVNIKTHSVPYCDTFIVEEEWTVMQLSAQSKCCVLRVTYGITFVKSTMMKSVITSSTVSETKKSWDAF